MEEEVEVKGKVTIMSEFEGAQEIDVEKVNIEEAVDALKRGRIHDDSRCFKRGRIRIKLRSFRALSILMRKNDGQNRGFGYLSLFSDRFGEFRLHQHEAKNKIEPKRNTVILQLSTE